MNYIELCAGLGGMGYGLMQAGMKCVGFAECDTKCEKCKDFTQHDVYKAKKFYTFCTVCGTPKKQSTHESFKILHDPEERMWSAYDVRSVTDDDIRLLGRERGPIQGLVAGFPCQAFSIAGKREGFNDTIRGTVFFEIIRFAFILRPEFILLENVTGLLNHDKGRTFETIIGTLDELGYMGEWCVLNSAAYVPQNRERVFIVASLRGSSGRKVFPFGSENSNSVEVIGRVDIKADDYCKRVYSTDGLSPCLPTMQGGSQEPKIMVAGQLDDDSGGTGKIYDPAGIAPTQLAQHGNAVTKVVVVGNTNPSGNGMNGQVFDAEGLSPTLTTNKGEGNKILVNVNQHEIRRSGISLCLDANYFKGLEANQSRTGVLEPVAVLTPDRLEKIQNGRRFKEPGEPAFTLTAQDKHGIYKGYRIRKLTPLECFRLQSFPDEWYYKLKKAGMANSQLYKMAGNAVTSRVAYEIGIRIMNRSEY